MKLTTSTWMAPFAGCLPSAKADLALGEEVVPPWERVRRKQPKTPSEQRKAAKEPKAWRRNPHRVSSPSPACLCPRIGHAAIGSPWGGCWPQPPGSRDRLRTTTIHSPDQNSPLTPEAIYGTFRRNPCNPRRSFSGC